MIVAKRLGAIAIDDAVLLRDVDFVLPCDANLMVVGESGSGKSTLLHLLAGLSLHRVSGTVSKLPPAVPEDRRSSDRRLSATAAGRHRDRRTGVDRRQRHLVGAFLALQDAGTAFSPYRTVGSQLADAVRVSEMDMLDEIMQDLGLDGPAVRRAYPHELSGGMLKRVLICGVLAPGPEVALFDEPTAGIDPSIRWRVVETIRRRASRFVVATHDMDLVRSATEEFVMVLRSGRRVEYGPAAELKDSPWEKYTADLLGGKKERGSDEG